MHTNTPEFLLADPLLEQARLSALEAGRFNIAEIQSKFKVGYRRVKNWQSTLIAEGVLDPTETAGQNWLAGSVVLQEQADDLENALDKIVEISGAMGSREFEKLVRVMAVERSAVMRMVVIAGIRSLLAVLGDKGG